MFEDELDLDLLKWMTQETRRVYGSLYNRTYRLGIDVIFLIKDLPEGRAENVVANQLLRSGTSVGANYRAAKRARSKAEWLAKLGIVEEEADETVHWLCVLRDAKLMKDERIQSLIQEASEILAMVVASIRTSRSNK
jgi:four helix bundle protein